ncbi:MAG TPA: hypothetical protein RMH85_07305 [Polyangiaceae bacterium LLY-WYZ-15_(1-7)]|nr:hypothetical protein [Myxococcales bacterium]MBJ73496.1 hypothetical protein [Sandaracinus sp.]HJK92012.1 hypothetical protein [Polyangiaceae bacterium LLY-WYZ-15_(1-7)]HJL00271.1 hypothetical protein [Polyangiaceae bacterium LLY-WYZ-15_(1-7)]HJL08286.1 hypothetical protein [Polyangiaceae bacterium LLY-WYZ-15_(1-7)]
MHETAHGALMQQWERMPLPLGEIGLLLRTSDADYLHRIFLFMEGTVSLAIAYGLALAHHRGELHVTASELADALDRASLGKRRQLLQRLPCGWDLRLRDESYAPLVAATLGESQLPRRGGPTIGQALDALVTARNQLAHPTLPAAVRPDLAGHVVDACVRLALSNAHFQARLLRCDGFGTTAAGRAGVVASSMTGIRPVPYRGGTPIEAPGIERRGQLFLRDPDGHALPLGPFLQHEDDQVFLLTDFTKGTPRFWSPLNDQHRTGESWGDAVMRTLTSAPAPPQASPPAPSRTPAANPTPRSPAQVSSALDSRPGTAPIRPRSNRIGFAAAGVASLLLISGLAAAALLSAPDEPTAEAASSAPSSPALSGTPAPSPDERPTDPTLRSLFDLEGVTFGVAADVLRPREIGEVPPRCPPNSAAANPPGRPWTVFEIDAPRIPGERRTVAWIDQGLGLFELNVFSGATPRAVAHWVENQLGQPPTATSTQGNSFRWELGEHRVNVGINRNGTTMLIVFHQHKKDAFSARRRLLCGTR